ncbi:PAS domain-containing protein [Aliiglaciecola sp.]|nr:PAS domain-containing protein [Aliiglaciecola sp.]
MQALANNDFIVNSLIDLQQRNDYLPLFFQSLRVSNASSASIGFFDFDGELIAGRNWSSVTLNESSGQWRSLVLSQGQNFRAVDADGVFIVVPVLLGELAEGALAMKADSLETFIRVEQNDAIQIIVNQQGMVLYSSRPDVMPISTVVSEHLMQDYVAEQREYGDLTVISYEEFGTAYASLLTLLPVLLLAMLAVAAVSSLSARLAAKYAAGTLTDFQLSLENEVHTSKAPQVDREAEDAKELQDIKRSFMHLKNELLKLSLSNDKVTSVINAMLEFLVVVDTQGNIVLCNRAFDEFSSNVVFENDTLRRLVDDFSSSLANDEVRNAMERSYVRINDGKVVTVQWRATPHTNSDGEGIGVVIIGEDVTA